MMIIRPRRKNMTYNQMTLLCVSIVSIAVSSSMRHYLSTVVLSGAKRVSMLTCSHCQCRYVDVQRVSSFFSSYWILHYYVIFFLALIMFGGVYSLVQSTDLVSIANFLFTTTVLGVTLYIVNLFTLYWSLNVCIIKASPLGLTFSR